MRLSIALLTLPFLALTSALPQITRTGKYLYDASGDRFFIKGVAYQPEGQLAATSEANSANGGFPEPSSYFDPLSSAQNCTRDLPYLEQLGINAIRVYSVNSSLNHDDCMKTFSDAGIYVLLDLGLPLNGSIDRASPAWTTNLLDEYTTTINAFKGYDNILSFSVGNEVINTVGNTNAAPFIKAAARDVKAYLKSVNSSAFVSYSATDGEADFRNGVAEYLTCGDDSLTIDLYGFNNYEWCGNETLTSSHYDTITSGFSNLTVPTYMSEFGCITSPPRLWTEVPAIFSSPVSDVFSGAVAFSYFPTSDGYGMVTISSDGNSVTTSDDFTRLSAQYNATSGPNSPAKSSVTTSTYTCPATKSIASMTLPPTPDESVCNCIYSNALACVLYQFSANEPIIVGALTDYACSLLGSTNATASCDTIGGNGTSGTYGALSFCSPAIKLDYAMSAYYEANPISTSCDFGGNATLSRTAPNTAQDASTAAQSCLAKEVSGGVFTPTAASSVSTASGTGSSTSSSTASASQSKSAGELAVTLIGGMGRYMSLAIGAAAAMAGGGWMLL